MKDLFSNHAALYRSFRPGYPSEMINHILSFVRLKEHAWDCATGNGQAAQLLAPHFSKVSATDISAAQLEQATRLTNIEYLQCTAENTPFGENTFDLITVAQAFHWLDWPAFHKEVSRVAKPHAVIAIWMYDRFVTGNEPLDGLMDHFYTTITGPYWDERRKYVDEHYASLPFPYETLPAPVFHFQTTWNREQLSGYLSSWSSVQAYIRQHQTSPLSLIEEDLQKFLPDGETIRASFPVYLKLGRIKK